jgi:UDP-N-acetylglucosamine 2-epimerase (non-hydrolysing)
MTAPIKVMTVFGTRPEIIRLSAVLEKLDRCARHVTVHTGQSYDYGLSEVFFRDFGLRKPDHFLEVKSATVGEQIGKILTRSEEVIRAERPDALLVLGDTNSALVAIIAKRYKVPVFHMEAGNRCFDENVPEELNRRIVDHIADVNLCYTDHARRYLLREGLPPGRVFVTGSPMAEVLHRHRERIDGSDVLTRLELKPDGYFVVSTHREENVESPSRLSALLETLRRVHAAHGCPVIVSTHPRTARRVEKRTTELDDGIRFCEPFGFFDYVHLQQHAFCVLSDSGTIFEESSILGFPAVVLRDSTERPEAIDTGACVQTGMDPELVLAGIELAVAERDDECEHRIPSDYRSTNVSSRVVRHICGQARIMKRKVWGVDNDINLFGQD